MLTYFCAFCSVFLIIQMKARLDAPIYKDRKTVPRVHKARSTKKWYSEFGVKELDWPAPQPTPLG